MNNEERLTIDGYLFMNDADAKTAAEEKKKIEYLNHFFHQMQNMKRNKSPIIMKTLQENVI